ncbi:unnamed protein product [Penicillium bialowiezense]
MRLIRAVNDSDRGQGAEQASALHWQAPDTTDTPDLVMKQIEDAIAAAAAPKGKCGDDYRNEKSLWDCDERVLNHPNVGPLQNGIPVGYFRPDDAGVGKDPVTRMKNRRLVLLNFSPSTGNKVWSLLNMNIYGQETPASINEKEPSAKAIHTANNIDWFTEFEGWVSPLYCASPGHAGRFARSDTTSGSH